ncbi:MAG: site-specific DNA-methyltransferase [Candidatus Aenigmatarchaeota archaeon]|nr:MAG: site-specific DNA-methyltransferase [Candidatus Aenigmarchaeota archaeon]
MKDNSISFEIGDSLILLAELKDDLIDLIFTDPPYNKGKDYGEVSDSKPEKEFWLFNTEWMFQLHRVLKPGHHFYMTCAHDQIDDFKRIAMDQGFKFRRLLIWATNECRGHMNARTWLASYEAVLWFQKPGKPYGLFNNYPYAALDVLLYRSPHRNSKKDKKYHIAQKPLELVKCIILKSSQEGDLVLDPFLGSGTTLVACVETKRKGLGFELNPEYESIIRKRLNGTRVPTSLRRFE